MPRVFVCLGARDRGLAAFQHWPERAAAWTSDSTLWGDSSSARHSE